MTIESHELALCVINDGDGSQCGYRYQERCSAAKHDVRYAHITAGQWLAMTATVVRWYEREYGASETTGKIFTTTDILLAALEVAEYYQKHVKEMDAA